MLTNWTNNAVVFITLTLLVVARVLPIRLAELMLRLLWSYSLLVSKVSFPSIFWDLQIEYFLLYFIAHEILWVSFYYHSAHNRLFITRLSETALNGQHSWLYTLSSTKAHMRQSQLQYKKILYSNNYTITNLYTYAFLRIIE